MSASSQAAFEGLGAARARLQTLVEGLREAGGGEAVNRAAQKTASLVESVAKGRLARHVLTGRAVGSATSTSSAGLVKLTTPDYLRYHAWWPFRRGMPPFVLEGAARILAAELLALIGDKRDTLAAREAEAAQRRADFDAEKADAKADAEAAKKRRKEAEKAVKQAEAARRREQRKATAKAQRAADREQAREQRKAARKEARKAASEERKAARKAARASAKAAKKADAKAARARAKAADKAARAAAKRDSKRAGKAR